MNEEQRALLDKAEELGWKCTVCDDGSIEFAQYSPAGEDFLFSIEGKDIAAEVKNYYEDFDPDNYAEEWVAIKHQPDMQNKGIPDIRTIMKDADDIDEMLRELSEALDEMEV